MHDHTGNCRCPKWDIFRKGPVPFKVSVTFPDGAKNIHYVHVKTIGEVIESLKDAYEIEVEPNSGT